jgi:hypothetical protein
VTWVRRHYWHLSHAAPEVSVSFKEMLSYLGNGITFPTAYAGDLKASGIAFPVIGLVLLLLRALLNVAKRIKPGFSEAFAIFSWLMIVGMGTIFVWSK